MTTAAYNESNPFAIRFTGNKGAVSYVLAHQPKSFDWRARGGKAHPWKQVSSDVLEEACVALNQIVTLTD
jgi:mRNA interferase MazF